MPTMPNWLRARLTANADPQCPYCWGSGAITYTSRNSDGEVEAACSCVEDRDEDEDAPPVVVQ